LTKRLAKRILQLKRIVDSPILRYHTGRA